jgi:hypothetical protein
VHWFIKSTRPEATNARAVVNRWYEDFPDPDRRLAVQLRSEADAHHYQALATRRHRLRLGSGAAE